MSQQPISRSLDLLRLRNKGFNVRIVAGHLVVDDIPYVNTQRQVRRGTLVSALALNNNVTGPPDTHVILFAGERPCRADGAPLSKIINSESAQRISDGLAVQFSFSSKPASGRYDNYYDKVATYAAILTNEAQAIDPTVKPQTFPLVPPDDDDGVFLYEDTASSRAGISAATAKLRQRSVVIAGLDGSGSYVLDLVAKTLVQTIRLYDGDVYQQHNAFRSPGAARGDRQKQPNKAQYWARQYAPMRRAWREQDPPERFSIARQTLRPSCRSTTCPLGKRRFRRSLRARRPSLIRRAFGH